jgi:hypothetical protein
VPSKPSEFRVFGFPVQVRPGFLMFMGLVVLLQGPTFGIPFAVLMAAFTLLHELGHAVAARSTGARARISLDFMAGYASFTPVRPLTPLERIGISFAGPGIQITVGGIAYVALRGQLAWPEAGHPWQQALFWAGPAIGMFNLLPLIPFDGGAIAEAAIALAAPNAARRIMEWATVVLTVAAVVVMATDPNRSRFLLFAVLPLASVLASMSAAKTRTRRAARQTVLSRAEALAWAGGGVQFPDGTVPSPWFRAWQQLQAGDTAAARHVVLLDLADTAPVNWWPPDAAPLESLQAVVDNLPEPLPTGRAYSAYVMSGVLLRLGRHDTAGRYAAAAYAHHREPMLAVHVARAAAALGQRDTALAWLRSAATANSGMTVEAAAVAVEFEPWRNDPEFTDALQGV